MIPLQVFSPALAESDLTIEADKESYEPDQLMTINGTYLPGEIVMILVQGPEGQTVWLDQVVVDEHGTFGSMFRLDPLAVEGTYTVGAIAGEAKTSVTVTVAVTPHASGTVTTTSTTTATTTATTTHTTNTSSGTNTTTTGTTQTTQTPNQTTTPSRSESLGRENVIVILVLAVAAGLVALALRKRLTTPRAVKDYNSQSDQ